VPASPEVANADVAVLGMPYDGGTNITAHLAWELLAVIALAR
jgi:hypothetical protein